MTQEQLEDIIDQYTQHCVDGMDLEDLQAFVYEHIRDNLFLMDQQALLDEIRDCAPHLID